MSADTVSSTGLRENNYLEFVKITMHELSLAQNIMEIVTESVEKSEATRVVEIELEIGTQSGVILEALQFAMDSLLENSIAEGAKIIYYKVDAIARCHQCNTTWKSETMFEPCPQCGSFESEIIQGKELQIKSIIAE